jgi:hypothetical protein
MMACFIIAATLHGPRLAIQGARPRGAFGMQIGRKHIFVLVFATPVLQQSKRAGSRTPIK